MDGWGAKKFGMSLETREIKLFGRDIPGFCWDILAVPEKFKKKKSLCSIFGPYKKASGLSLGNSEKKSEKGVPGTSRPRGQDCFRGRHRGGRNFTSSLHFSGPFFHAAK